MGRVHKKKLAEYAEAVEDEEVNNKNSEKETEDDDEEVVDSVVVKGEQASGAGGAQDAAASAKKNDGDDFQSLASENAKDVENGNATKKSNKRKATEKTAKKTVADGDEDSDDETLKDSGQSDGGPKKARKTVAAVGKGKGAKSGKGGKNENKGNAVENGAENDEVEKEYEVKEIVGHKVERGVSHYLIRWKGYTKSDDTWEPEDTLSCPDLIEKYKKKQSANGGPKSSKKNVTPGKKGRPAKNKATEDPNKEWEVEKIIDYSEEAGERIFRIRWKGFGSRFDTWEPEKNLFCDDIIKKFMQRMKSQSNITFKELREEPKRTKRLVNETVPRSHLRNPAGRKSKRAITKKRVYYGDSDE